jgi:hypothetical protein
MSLKVQPCTKGKRHKWVFVKNVTTKTQTLRSISITRRGVYRCACGERKYGPEQ